MASVNSSGDDLYDVHVYGTTTNPNQEQEVGLLRQPSDVEIIVPTVVPEKWKRWWFFHPVVQGHLKVVAGSWALFILGIVLFISGTFIEIRKNTEVQSFVFYIAGAICIIPGFYHVVYIYFAVKGWCGFKFSHLSAFH